MNNEKKELFDIKLKILLNKKMFEDKVITIDVYQKMENLLVAKLSKVST